MNHNVNTLDIFDYMLIDFKALINAISFYYMYVTLVQTNKSIFF